MRNPLDEATLIAIVDDDDLVRASLESLFRSFGVQAEAFPSAANFLSECPDRFDIVVSDLQMPGMTGIELKRILSERTVPTPVIIITAYSDRATDLVRTEEGLHLLEKPVDGTQLISCIEKVLGRPIS